MTDIETIEPDRDLIDWSRQYRKAIDLGKSLREVRLSEAFPPGVNFVDPGPRDRLARRWINGSWLQ